MKKKLLLAVVILCMAFAFTGCQRDTPEVTTTTEAAAESTIPATDEPEIREEVAETTEVGTTAVEDTAQPAAEETASVAEEKTAERESPSTETTGSQTTNQAAANDSATQSASQSQTTSGKTNDKNTSTNNNGTTTSSNAGTTGDKTTTDKVTETTKPATHTHSYTSKVTKAATCAAAGECTYTCSCGDSYTESIAATGSHNWVEKTHTVHHDEVGHKEENGHEEQVKTGTKGYVTCTKCGYSEEWNGSISDDMLYHLVYTCDASHKITYQPIYETQWVSDGEKWVVDTPAYDETVSDGYQCSVCGATK